MAYTYMTSYEARYNTPRLMKQTEVATVASALSIMSETGSGTPHENRRAWATWTIKNASVSKDSFHWLVASNNTILDKLTVDPSGETVLDSEVKAVVDAYLPGVIADFIDNPPPGA